MVEPFLDVRHVWVPEHAVDVVGKSPLDVQVADDEVPVLTPSDAGLKVPVHTVLPGTQSAMQAAEPVAVEQRPKVHATEGSHVFPAPQVWTLSPSQRVEFGKQLSPQRAVRRPSTSVAVVHAWLQD
jgi:hypothetical protein